MFESRRGLEIELLHVELRGTGRPIRGQDSSPLAGEVRAYHLREGLRQAVRKGAYSVRSLSMIKQEHEGAGLQEGEEHSVLFFPFAACSLLLPLFHAQEPPTRTDMWSGGEALRATSWLGQECGVSGVPAVQGQLSTDRSERLHGGEVARPEQRWRSYNGTGFFGPPARMFGSLVVAQAVRGSWFRYSAPGDVDGQHSVGVAADIARRRTS